MSYSNHDTKRIDYEARKRDLSEKYSYAVSRLGTCNAEKREYWRQKLEQVNANQAAFNDEWNAWRSTR